jgi:hypothetical protein
MRREGKPEMTNPGGQHAAPIGTDTLDHIDQFGFSIGLRKAGEHFDVDSAPDAEPQPATAEALAEFNRELQRAITEEFDTPF